MKPASILVVDDDPSCIEYLELLLSRAGYAVRTAQNGVEALIAVDEATPDAILSDLRMPEMDGVQLLVHIKQRWPELPVIIVTVEEELSCVVESVRKGAVNYLLKPCSADRILDAVRKAVIARVPQTVSVGGQIPEVVGRSKSIVEVKHAVSLAARTDVNVLITGETGTGKELVARAIHRLSSLARGPFVAHNCAIAPHDLVESQFFGSERGAFTGADREQAGLLEAADGGCLFLDELEAMTTEQQAKLLRVIDDGEFRRLGAARVRRVSVRFLAAMNHDPQDAIRRNGLREDLYYRLRGFEISLPPLRERREDIPLLAHHFLREQAGELTPLALEALTAHRWPGNVRELKNVVHAARACAAGRPIDAEHLKPWLGPPPARDVPRPATSATGVRTLHDAEKEAIQDALKTFDGNLSRAARTLGIDRSTLRRKLAEMLKDNHSSTGPTTA